MATNLSQWADLAKGLAKLVRLLESCRSIYLYDSHWTTTVLISTLGVADGAYTTLTTMRDNIKISLLRRSCDRSWVCSISNLFVYLKSYGMRCSASTRPDLQLRPLQPTLKLFEEDNESVPLIARPMAYASVSILASSLWAIENYAMLPRPSSLPLGHTILTAITVPKVLSERKFRRINIQRCVAVT
jgi:hypothetical protein